MPDQIKILTTSDPDYPPLLQQVHRPPSHLYIRGNPEILQSPHILAVVGTRKPSAYGQQCVERLLTPVVNAGVVIASGLAYGIDSLAHHLCVERHQPTIAVLGSGIDNASIYPRRHLSLAHQIIKHGGAVISEHPAGTPARPGHFPARNRIIAGLAGATLVIQAAQRSGSLITARLALETGRDVIAVPGAITDPLSAGTNYLIQQGAAPAIEPADLLDLFGISPDQSTKPITYSNLTTQQQNLAQQLSTTPQHIDQLSQQANLPSNAISVTLTELELLNIVQHVGGSKYIKK